jgi:hypothetical protein
MVAKNKPDESVAITELVVNTDVMMRGSKKGNEPYEAPIRLLENLKNDTNLILVMDERGTIRSEYERKMQAQDLGLRIIVELLNAQRLRLVPTLKDGDGWKKPRIALQQAKLHKEDRAFVRTAMVSESRILIADEDDFREKKVKKAIRDANVKVMNSVEAVSDFCESVP